MKTDSALAYFITPHGFGHAARACAVMNALASHNRGSHFLIFTSVPEWVFAESLQASFEYHSLVSDVGVAQKNALEEDLPATVAMLSHMYPLDDGLVEQFAQQLRASHARAVLCDIAPVGLLAAQKAGIPSFLVENFTWDWIYEGYADREPGLLAFIPLLKQLFSQADHHIQTRPMCDPRPVDLVSAVVSRQPRQTREQVRTTLGIGNDVPLVLITMGGIAEQFPFFMQLRRHPEVQFVIPAAADRLVREQNLILLPHHTPVYHPDIVSASDVVVGKLGYSTLAEVYRAGIPYAYVPRQGFRESGPLSAFVHQEMDWLEIAASEFNAGLWVDSVLGLLQVPRRLRDEPNGAESIASYVLEKLG